MTEHQSLHQHLAQIQEQGFTILYDAIEPGLVEALADHLRRLEHELSVRPADNLFEGVSTKRIYNLLAYGPLWERIPVHPAVLPLVEAVLDPGLLVSSLSSIAIGPGETPQPLHADDQVVALPRPHQPIICNTMWALTDFTEANGATRLVPGSHLFDHPPDLGRHYETVAAAMPRGSVLVWVGSLWHGGGANATDTPRVGIAMNYCAGFLRQQENQQLGLSKETVGHFSRRLQELVGYSIYRGLIGHIDKRHPAEVVLGARRQAQLLWDYARRPS